MHRLLSIITALVSSIVVTQAQQHAQYQYNPRNYVCQRASATLTIDGDLDEQDWQDAPWTDDFIDIEGEIRPAPYYRTRAKMLWDEDYLYIAAELEEEHLWATYDQRDMVIFHENDFEVFIDPDGDTHNYYELEINALGTIWDLLLTKPYRDGGRAIDAWDIRELKKGITLYGTLNDPSDLDEKWTVELAFPWSVLQEAAPRKIPEDGDIWRLGFSRVHWQLDTDEQTYSKKVNPTTGKPYPEYNWVWSPQGAIAMHQPETWGFLQFSGVPVSQRIIDFTPDPEDETKWLLRQVYYAQQAYQEANGEFASLITQLKIPPSSYEGAEFFMSPTNFEVILKDWSIQSDGRIKPVPR